MEKILTVTNVAEILQVKAITVREMFREKRLRGFKVGKSWRTTETMLREDIDALARGESPAELPMPNAAPASAGASPAATPPAATPPAATPPAAKTPPAEVETSPPAPKPRPARKPAAAPAPDAENNGDDTQQMLF